MSKLNPKDPDYPSLVANAYHRFGEIHVTLSQIERDGGAHSVEEELALRDLEAEKQQLIADVGLDKLSP